MPRRQRESNLVKTLYSGDRRSAAKLITMAENEDPGTTTMMKEVDRHVGRAYVIGVTGPLGVGKSTFIDAIVKEYRNRKKTVGVVAIDPSSRVTGGALLGDRVRLTSNIGDKGVFFRSISTRGCMGGLARCTKNVVKILDAYGSDVIIVETAGAGQSDVEVQDLVHTTIVILSPTLGDEIQLMKSGIVEIADIFVVNKADLPGAEIMESMLGFCLPKDNWVRPVVKTISNKAEGIKKAADAIQTHRDYWRSKKESIKK